MSAKSKGSRNERRAIKVLEAAGYTCTKAGGSLGLFDIVAISKQGIRLVQVKTGRNAPPHEREAIAEFDNFPPGSTKELWIWFDYQRQPQITVIK